MKKSLVITTIATVLVIVVALTTATFAWFSSSSSTQATDTFTAQASSSLFALYKYESSTTGGSYSVTSNSSILFNEAAGSTSPSSTFGIWTSSDMKSFAPSELIDVSDLDVVPNDTAWGGLPGAAFFTANSENNKNLKDIKEVSYEGSAFTTTSTGTPNVARLKLENFKDAEQKLQIKVTINPNGEEDGTQYDLRFAEAIRFLIIATPMSGANAGKTVVFGTHYDYGLNSETVGAFPTEATVSSYKNTSGVDQGYTGSDTLTVDLFNPVELNNTASGSCVYTTSKGDFVLAAGDELDMYIYVWLDGPLAGSSLSKGTATFTIDFGVEA